MKQSGTTGSPPLVLLALLCAAATAVANTNQPPVAEAGPSRYIANSALELDGTGSADPDGDPLNYQWSQLSGPTIVLTDANTATPAVQATQTDQVQVAILQLIVNDGTLPSQPDEVTITIVPTISSAILMNLENPPFDPDKPTFVFFGGGDCNTGGGDWNGPEWWEVVNVIDFDVYAPPYEQCGDKLITYLSAMAPDYDQPIQTAGHSTGGMPTIDTAIRMNTLYQDPRYAVNRVALLDVACRSYSSYIQQYVENPVAGEPAWVEYIFSTTEYSSYAAPYAVTVNVLGGHWEPFDFYRDSIRQMAAGDPFNHGMVAGAFCSTAYHGGNYHIQGLNPSPYHFKKVSDLQDGHLEHFDEAARPGRLPEPVVLIGPENGDEVGISSVALRCAASENAVAYDLLVGAEPRHLDVVLTSSESLTVNTGVLPFATTLYWTIQARDAFDSAYRPYARSFTTPPGFRGDFNGDSLVDATDCSLFQAAISTTWGDANFLLAADLDGDQIVTCADSDLWLTLYRDFHQNPALPAPCGLEDSTDDDGDNVRNPCDACPGTLAGLTVDEYGCPPEVPGDMNRDGDVDQSDFGLLQACLSGSGIAQNNPACLNADLDKDDDVDESDVSLFRSCTTGANVPADPNCAE